MQLIGGGGRESTKILGMLNLPWQVFEKKTFTACESEIARWGGGGRMNQNDNDWKFKSYKGTNLGYDMMC